VEPHYQIDFKATLYVDYFKLGLTRNWEPLVEPFKCLVMYERTIARGKGITFNADCPLHINVTSAVIGKFWCLLGIHWVGDHADAPLIKLLCFCRSETIDDAVKTMELSRAANSRDAVTKRRSVDSGIAKSFTAYDRVNNFTFRHRPAEQLYEDERVAFSLKNITGDRVRVHTQSAGKSTTATISYLDHSDLMPLRFPATKTVINNLQSLELPFKGDQNISSTHERVKTVIDLKIDLQVPGFRWVRRISLDKPGKHFVQLHPRSSVVEAKICEDWRLRNALQILTEIRSVNGGRRLSIKSPFEIINKTNHPIFVGEFRLSTYCTIFSHSCCINGCTF